MRYMALSAIISPIMLNCKNMKIIMGIILLNIILYSGLQAQGNKEYPALRKFSKWGIVAGPVLYNSAKIYPQYGDYELSGNYLGLLFSVSIAKNKKKY